jgi:hypothetical protein
MKRKTAEFTDAKRGTEKLRGSLNEEKQWVHQWNKKFEDLHFVK